MKRIAKEDFAQEKKNMRRSSVASPPGMAKIRTKMTKLATTELVVAAVALLLPARWEKPSEFSGPI
jgi:hypothetical protein